MQESPKELKVFSGVMDADTESRFIKDGDYRYLLNARNSINSKGNFGAVVDVMGNLKIPNPYLQAGRNKCVGTIEDIAGQSIIFAVWNENGYHGWFRWFFSRQGYDNGVIEKIYQVADPSAYDKFNPDPLGFTENDLITGANIIDGSIYWTNGAAQPKFLDIERANITNKRFKFNVYIDQDALPFQTRYFVNVYGKTPSNNASFTIVTSASTLTERIAAIANRINSPVPPNSTSNGKVRATSKDQYLEIECLFIEEAYVIISEGNIGDPVSVKSVVVPANFYPDNFGSLGGYFYEALTDWNTNVIKSPPTCQPSAVYTKFSKVSDLAFIASPTSSNPVATGEVLPVGFSAPVLPYFDTTGNFTYGSANIVTTTSSSSTPNAYFDASGLLNKKKRFKIELTFRLTPNGFSGGILGFTVGVYDFSLPTTSRGFRGQVYNSGVINPTGPVVYTVSLDVDYDSSMGIIAPTIDPTNFFVPPTIEIISSTFLVTVDESYRPSRIRFETPYIFRLKYQYFNNQQSVYGAISTTPKPVTYTEDSIELSFTDSILTDNRFLWEIKQLTLALSRDNGATWNDFKVLYPFEFLGANNQKYSFLADEQLLPVSLSESALAFHAVPIKADSQEYADDRLWLGSIEEGYDNLPINIGLNIDYALMTDNILYPSSAIKDAGVKNKNYGSFFKRGWSGKLGLVYYDDYDRVSGVQLGENSGIRIRYWNEPDSTTGVIPVKGAPYIEWSITHEPPLWATKYQWVRTLNTESEVFLQWAPRLRFATFNQKLIPLPTELVFLNFPTVGTQVFKKGDIVAVTTGTIATTAFTNSRILTVNQTVNLKVGDVLSNWLRFPIGTYITRIISASQIEVSNFPTSAGTDAAVMYAGWDNLYYRVGPDQVAPEYNAFNDPSLWVKAERKYAVLDYSNIADYNKESDSKLTFSASVGDIVRYEEASTYAEYPVDYVLANLVYVLASSDYIKINAPLAQNTDVKCEIFTPASSTDSKNQQFYEFGQCYKVKEAVFGGVLKKYHEGQTQDQSFGLSPENIITPATGTFAYGAGDVWYRDQVLDSIDASPYDGEQIPQYTLVCRRTIEDSVVQVSDNNGRAKIILPDQQQLISSFRFGNRFESRQLNSLNAFEPANIQTYTYDYGSISKMIFIGNDVMRLIFANSVQMSIYVNQGVIRQAQGNGALITVADDVAGNSHIVQRTLGCITPEAVVMNDEGDVMGYDELEGISWRSSGNGLIQISDYKQKSTFKNFGTKRAPFRGNVSQTPAVYDLFHDEYILTLNSITPAAEVLPVAVIEVLDTASPPIGYSMKIILQPNNTLIYDQPLNSSDVAGEIVYAFSLHGNILSAVQNADGTVSVTAPTVSGYENSTLLVQILYWDGSEYISKTYSAQFSKGQPAETFEPFQGVTIAFNKQKQGYPQYYSFLPEYYGRMRDVVAAFQSGELYLQDRGDTAKNFFGVQYSRKLTYVGNAGFPKVKGYKAININGVGLNSCPSIVVPPFQGASLGMFSTLSRRHFEVLEGIQYAAFQKDQFTPGYQNYFEAQLNGRELRGQLIEVTLENTDTSQSVVYSSELVYFYSENS